MPSADRYTHHLTIPMTEAADGWLGDFGRGNLHKGIRKTAKYRLIDLAVALGRETLKEPIDFLEPGEIEDAVEALKDFSIQDAEDAANAWKHIRKANAGLAQTVRSLTPYQKLRLIFHVLHARR